MDNQERKSPLMRCFIALLRLLQFADNQQADSELIGCTHHCSRCVGRKVPKGSQKMSKEEISGWGSSSLGFWDWSGRGLNIMSTV
eukprot:15366492-Ditylum_brightwellii.AAC.3